MNYRIFLAKQFHAILGPISLGLLVTVNLAPNSYAQTELRADRQIAFESGHGTLVVKEGPNGQLYALNHPDRCIWVFESSGTRSIARISSAGMGPADLLAPNDFAVDRAGNVIVADATGPTGMIRIFTSEGKLLSSFPFKRPQHVGLLSDGRVLVSGFPTDSLISVFDRRGRQLGSIGQPVKADDDPFTNSVLNMGSMVVDERDNIYYIFVHLLAPTVREYTPDGKLVAEWHLHGGHVDRIAREARNKYEQNKKTGGGGVLRILPAGGFDRDTQTLWIASGPQLSELDSSGNTIRALLLLRPDGRWLPAESVIIDRDLIRAATPLAGIFEFLKPH